MGKEEKGKRKIEGRVNALLVVGILLIVTGILLFILNFNLVLNYFQVGEEKAGAGELYTGIGEEERVRVMAGNTYYVSNSGNDSNLGTISEPWKTFSYAIPLLMPGDTLILVDGEYNLSNSGLLLVDCANNANNGTSINPVTIKAENERKALINSEGRDTAIRIFNCNYWNLIGLRAKSADLPTGSGGKQRDIVNVQASENIVLKRVISTNNNRYFNDHTFSVIDSKNILFEECEAYYFHRHGFSIWKSHHITLRRCYANSRAYVDISGGYVSGNPSGGDEAFVFYQSSDSIAENSISENKTMGFEAHGGTTFDGLSGGDNNKFLGTISIYDSYGGIVDARPYTNLITPENPYGIEPAENNLYKNFLVLNPIIPGIYLRDGSNTLIESATVINSLTHRGIAADSRETYTPCATNPGKCTFTVRNSIVVDNNVSGILSIEQDSWLFDYTNSFNNGVTGIDNYYPSETINDATGNITNSMSIAPELGNCLVYIPSASPMKNAGKDGEDIGANILYKYENGVLTTQQLWNATTGEFPCGAIVPGINDRAGDSCFDVHKRLNVNYNGCYLPYYAGTIYYVSNSGDDLNDGLSEATPWKTITNSIPKLKPGDTLLVRGGIYREGNIEVLTSGSVTNPINIKNYPGETPLISGSFEEFETIGNTAWQVYNSSINLYQSINNYDCPKEVKGKLEYNNQIYSLVDYTNFESIKTENQYPDINGIVYLGPGIFCNSSERKIYARLEPPSPEPLFGKIYNIPSNPDPRQNKLFISNHYYGIYFNPAGNIMVNGIDIAYHNIPIRLFPGSGNITIKNLALYPGFWDGIVIESNVSNILVDNVTFDAYFPDWISWADVKTQGTPGYRMKSGGIGLGSADNVTIKNSVFKNLFDGITATGILPSRNIKIINNSFEVVDDSLQLGTSSYNIEFGHNIIIGPGVSHDGTGTPIIPGTKYIHHNVIDSRKEIFWGRVNINNVPDTKYVGYEAHSPFPSHAGIGSGDGDPWKIYHNTILAKNISTVGIGIDVYGPNLTGVYHEVYNNIIVQYDDHYISRGAGMADRSMIYDGNLWYKPVNANKPAFFIWENGTQTVSFNNLADFKSSIYFNLTKAYYPPGWENSGVWGDPEIDENYRPSQSSIAASGAVDLSSKNWPGLSGETFRGALSPFLYCGNTVCETGESCSNCAGDCGACSVDDGGNTGGSSGGGGSPTTKKNDTNLSAGNQDDGLITGGEDNRNRTENRGDVGSDNLDGKDKPAGMKSSSLIYVIILFLVIGIIFVSIGIVMARRRKKITSAF